jgi:hypothetical protein
VLLPKDLRRNNLVNLVNPVNPVKLCQLNLEVLVC